MQKTSLNFDNGKLIPAVVQDWLTNEVLMLAYVNKESYEHMLESKQTWFWSRSRCQLWHKGETSGHFQNIKKMFYDCDADTLLIKVEQIGVACHTGQKSCFFNEVLEFASEIPSNDILSEIYDTIKDRKDNPIPKSYTNYLLDEGTDKICKKVGEEATEVIIAAKNNDKDSIVNEIGDLAYHIIALMFVSQVTTEDVKKLLYERHKKTGNKKEKNDKGEF